MDERKQVIPLGFRKLQFKSKNELDDWQVEGYYSSGTFPFIWKLWRRNQQFLL
jgi:hypothetical protein